MNATNYKNQLNLRHEPRQFSSRDLAFSAANRSQKTAWVMLGDNEKFWVVCPADAAKLERMGYEYAK